MRPAVAVVAALVAGALSAPACAGSADPGDRPDAAVADERPATSAIPVGPDPAGDTPDPSTSPASTPTTGVPVEVDATEGAAGPDDGSGSDPAAPPNPDDPMPASASALADALDRAERAVRDPSLTDDDAGAWGRYQQRLYRHLARHPDWAEEALALDDPALRRAAELNWEARLNLQALLASHGPEPELPAWRVVAPRPASELLGYYRDGEDRWGIDWEYLAAINLIETRMGRIEGVSSAGAVGPMQFLPTTWAECCEGDATDPADAIPGAARYLTIRGGPENMERAIWGYNNSDHYVAAVSAYAEVLRADEQAYRGYHAWEIFFASTEGLVLLPVGYEEPEPVPAAQWLAANPQYLLDAD